MSLHHLTMIIETIYLLITYYSYYIYNHQTKFGYVYWTISTHVICLHIKYNYRLKPDYNKQIG